MEENELIPVDNNPVEYTDDNIRHLSDMEHVRTRPGMYIGKLGDGSHPEDGIYVLLKEVIDNSIDEFKMQSGKKIEIRVEENLRVSVRDYGRGIPQGKLIEAVSVLNTGGKYDSKAFKKSVGLNGVGVKAVNALSSNFEVRSYRDGKVRCATFTKEARLGSLEGTANTALAVSCEPTATTLIHPKPVSSAISCFNLPRTVPGKT
ncbi:ATP-binding protein, partial [Bacteroides fragilis]|uniref:ATP-binding protein n=1 Tax=Bacteroides fragilis TaxID=817 RepID=UPI000A59BB23